MDDTLNTVIQYILIVDDDHDDHLMLSAAIKKEVPYAIVESVYDGDEAIAFLSNCRAMPNIILLDLNMSRLSGQETIQLIKANEVLCKVPVVIITTSRNKKEKARLLAMGASGFYTKPSGKEDMELIVSQIKEKWLS